MLEDVQLWDLKQVEWTVTLQTMQGTGFELLEKIFLQSSQQFCTAGLGALNWVVDGACC